MSADSRIFIRVVSVRAIEYLMFQLKMIKMGNSFTRFDARQKQQQLALSAPMSSPLQPRGTSIPSTSVPLVPCQEDAREEPACSLLRGCVSSLVSVPPMPACTAAADLDSANLDFCSVWGFKSA